MNTNLTKRAVADNRPVVSVVTVTYNQEKHLRKTIEGIISQKTTFPYELIIGEDCSRDKTREICIEYQQKCPDKIRLLLHEENTGMHENFLQTVRLARGTYIALCEGDDFWTDPNKLQLQYDILEKNPTFSGVHTKVCYVNTDGTATGQSDLMPENSCSVSFDYLVQKNVIHTCSFMFRRSILEDSVCSILSVAPAPDYALFLAAALKGDIYYLDRITAAYRQNAGVTSSWKFEQYLKCRLVNYDLLQKHLNTKKHRPAIYTSKQFQYFHLFSMPRHGRQNLVRIRYLVMLIRYTVLSCLFTPPVRVQAISIGDVAKLILKSRFRLKNWHNYLISEERIEK